MIHQQVMVAQQVGGATPGTSSSQNARGSGLSSGDQPSYSNAEKKEFKRGRKSKSEPVSPRRGRSQDPYKIDPELINRFADLSVSELTERLRRMQEENLQASSESETEFDDVGSEGSGEIRIAGLHNVFKRVVKPVGSLLDPTKRDDQATLVRSAAHLQRITPASVSRALKEEEIMRKQEKRYHELSDVVLNISRDLQRLKSESTSKSRAVIEKSGKLFPCGGHPPESRRAADDMWVKAVSSLQSNVKIIEREILFRDRPYDYLLEVCGASNSIATNF